MTDVTIRQTRSLKGEICAPPSKAYTQRMLIASALSHGTSKLSDPLISEDTDATLRAVKALGARVTHPKKCWVVNGSHSLTGAKEPIDCGESGATLRFMVPVAALAKESSVFILGKGLAKRPIEPLLRSLAQLGAKTIVEDVDGQTRIRVEGGGMRGGKTDIVGDVSSQFISGLMFACPMADLDTEIALTTPLESRSYVQMTNEILAAHGIKVSVSENFRTLKIRAHQTYSPLDQHVPGDFSSAAFLLGAAAITKSLVTVKNLDYTTKQGDKIILGILKKMGVDGKVCPEQIEIKGKGAPLDAVDVNAKDVPDLVPICAALACYAKGSSSIHNAQRLRLKESDRIGSLYVELRKMGAEITVDRSSLTLKGPIKLHGGTIDPHNDHRIAMACAVAALGAEGETTIENAECVRKSYPHFFTDLHSLGADIVGGELVR